MGAGFLCLLLVCLRIGSLGRSTKLPKHVYIKIDDKSAAISCPIRQPLRDVSMHVDKISSIVGQPAKVGFSFLISYIKNSTRRELDGFVKRPHQIEIAAHTCIEYASLNTRRT